VQYAVTVENNSDDAIADLVVTVRIDPPSVIFDEMHAEEELREDRLLPRSDAMRNRGIPFGLRIAPGASAPEHSVSAEMTFTDAAGVRWLRDANHQLSEVPA
jgi:hypothetical protein